MSDNNPHHSISVEGIGDVLTIRFRTREFTADGEPEHEMPGELVAGWVRSELITAGISAREPMQEDYGWGFWLEHQTAVWVAVSFADGGTTTDDPTEWVVSVVHERSLFFPAQWFRRRLGQAMAVRAFDVIRTALAARPAVIEWNVDHPE